MFFDTIAAINKVVNDFVWGVPAMVCIIGVYGHCFRSGKPFAKRSA